MSNREPLHESQPLLVPNPTVEGFPESEDGGEVILRVREGEEVHAERLRRENRVEV